jgi:hypothetical protein
LPVVTSQRVILRDTFLGHVTNWAVFDRAYLNWNKANAPHNADVTIWEYDNNVDVLTVDFRVHS